MQTRNKYQHTNTNCNDKNNTTNIMLCVPALISAILYFYIRMRVCYYAIIAL